MYETVVVMGPIVGFALVSVALSSRRWLTRELFIALLALAIAPGAILMIIKAGGHPEATVLAVVVPLVLFGMISGMVWRWSGENDTERG